MLQAQIFFTEIAAATGLSGAASLPPAGQTGEQHATFYKYSIVIQVVGYFANRQTSKNMITLILAGGKKIATNTIFSLSVALICLKINSETNFIFNTIYFFGSVIFLHNSIFFSVFELQNLQDF